jgi:AAA family ATP:ADP antiporter
MITVVFWGGLNQIIPKESAKTFYPICIALGNLSGICSGQFSYYILKFFEGYSWATCMQIMITSVAIASVIIIGINHVLHQEDNPSSASLLKKKSSLSFTAQITQIFKSPSMLYIALLVISIALANNLSEVLWKNSIKNVYPDPRSYNAYINQITSVIGFIAVIMSLLSRFLFQRITPSIIFLMTPIILLITSSCFFATILLPEHTLIAISGHLNISHFYLVMFLGSIHYIFSLTTKYSILDACKEFAYLNIDQENRLQAKSIIDTIGSRLGKTGSCVFHQFLILFIANSFLYISSVAVCVTLGLLVLFVSIKKLSAPTAQEPLLESSSAS